MNGSNKFEFKPALKMRFLLVSGIGIILAVIGYFAGHLSADRFWANYLLDTVYFLGISVLAVFTIAATQIAIGGWYIVMKRINEAMSQFLIVGAFLFLVIIVGVWAGYNHLYVWNNDFIKKEVVTKPELDDYMQNHTADIQRIERAEGVGEKESADEMKEVQSSVHPDASGNIQNPYYDEVVTAKSGYLNRFAWTLRALLYIGLWTFIAFRLRKISLSEDIDGNIKWYMKTKFWSAIFLVVWAVSSSMMAWDWVMSLDAHWYSTMFGWYNFISLWVASISVTILIIVYLKRQKLMPQLNTNHLHNLGIIAFAFSIFWTYLWFSQYMLIWYGNIPEETKWFLLRTRDYRTAFYINLGMNFLFPFLVLMRRGAKRNTMVLVVVAISLICTHWLDFYLMIMPSVMGAGVKIGLLEIGMFLSFAGLFLLVVFRALSRAPLIAENHPLYKESLQHHI